MRIEQRRRGLYDLQIDFGPDDWAASLRTAGRTLRLPLQMIDTQPAPALGRGAHVPCRERTSKWQPEL